MWLARACASPRADGLAVKALCLSGGGARGSFQVGAIKCLYVRYGYRPDLIVGTSVVRSTA